MKNENTKIVDETVEIRAWAGWGMNKKELNKKINTV